MQQTKLQCAFITPVCDLIRTYAIVVGKHNFGPHTKVNAMRLFSTLLLATLVLAASCTWAKEPAPNAPAAEAGKYRVLLLGDSISIGYTPYVQKMLAEKADVFRPMSGKGAENCAGTNNGVQHIDRWLKIEGGNFDVIHFNFGLHDLKHVTAGGANSNDPNDPHQANPEQYGKQLRAMVAKMKATGAKLIFATTTPVPEGGVSPYRSVDDPQRYNEIAKAIMTENEIAVNDLYAFALPRLKEIQRPVNVHFSNEGSRLLAEEVVKHIEQARLPLVRND